MLCAFPLLARLGRYTEEEKENNNQSQHGFRKEEEGEAKEELGTKPESEVETKLLGEGSYGTVIAGCRKGATSPETEDCNYAIKQFSLGGGTSSVATTHIIISDKEIYFLHMLQDIKLNGHFIVPRLLEAWRCEEEVLYVMDRYEGDMYELGKEQLEEARKKSCFWSIRFFDLPYCSPKNR